jgi:hypothetical protein
VWAIEAIEVGGVEDALLLLCSQSLNLSKRVCISDVGVPVDEFSPVLSDALANVATFFSMLVSLRR